MFPCRLGNRFTHVFIVTSHFNQGSLESYSIRSVREAGEIFAKVLTALKFMHSKSILHRDVKRENIFVARSPGSGPLRVVLGDFGLSRGSRRSMTSDVVTLPYRAPCLLLDKVSYGPEVDVYAAGCVLFEMLGGVASKDTLVTEKMLGKPHLAFQMALVPPEEFSKGQMTAPASAPSSAPTSASSSPVKRASPYQINDWGEMGRLAQTARVDLVRCLNRSRNDMEIVQLARSRWSNLEERMNLFERGALIQVSRDYLRRLLCFFPEERITIDQALKHPFLIQAGVNLEIITDVEGDYNSIPERFQEEADIFTTHEMKALRIKENLWSIIRQIPERKEQLPVEIMDAFPGEFLTQEEKGEVPLYDEYKLEFQTPESPEELQPVAKRTRSATIKSIVM